MISNDSSARIFDSSYLDELVRRNLQDPEVRAGIEQGLADVAAGRVYTTEEVFDGLEEQIWQWAKDIS